jgi:hypothetical protein
VIFAVRSPLGPDPGSNSTRIPTSRVARRSGGVSARRWKKTSAPSVSLKKAEAALRVNGLNDALHQGISLLVWAVSPHVHGRSVADLSPLSQQARRGLPLISCACPAPAIEVAGEGFPNGPGVLVPLGLPVGIDRRLL